MSLLKIGNFNIPLDLSIGNWWLGPVVTTTAVLPPTKALCLVAIQAHTCGTLVASPQVQGLYSTPRLLYAPLKKLLLPNKFHQQRDKTSTSQSQLVTTYLSRSSVILLLLCFFSETGDKEWGGMFTYRIPVKILCHSVVVVFFSETGDKEWGGMFTYRIESTIISQTRDHNITGIYDTEWAELQEVLLN